TQRSKSFEAGSERLQPCGVGPVVIGQQNVRHRQSVVSRITHVVHLKLGPSSRGKEEMVGTTGFEPATSRTPSVRATRLRYVPTALGHQSAYHSRSRRVKTARSSSCRSSRNLRCAREGGSGRAARCCGASAATIEALLFPSPLEERASVWACSFN